MKKLSKSFKTMEKYIKEFYNNFKYQYCRVKTGLINLHHWCILNDAYTKTGFEVGSILLTGLVIWLMLIPMVNYNPLWYVPSYGVVPWFLINFIREIRQ